MKPSPIHVFVDSSSLRKEAGPANGALSRVTDLSRSGVLDLYLHRIVVMEFVTGRAQEYEDAVKKVAVAQRAIAWLPEEQRATLSPAARAIEDASADFVARIRAGVDAWLEYAEVEVLEPGPDDTASAWDAYFSGRPPFKGPKNRNDLPDGFIFAGLRKIMAAGKTPMHVVTADGALRDACAKLPDLVLHEKLSDLLRHEEVVGAIRAHDEAKKGEARGEFWLAKARDAVRNARDFVAHEVAGPMRKELEGLEISDPSLPSDNHDATVTGVGEITVELECASLANLGADEAVVPVRAFVEDLRCDLFIYKDDYWLMAEESREKFDLEDSDWNKHYVSAAIEWPAEVTGDVRVTFETDEDGEVRVVTAEFEGIREIHLSPGD